MIPNDPAARLRAAADALDLELAAIVLADPRAAAERMFKDKFPEVMKRFDHARTQKTEERAADLDDVTRDDLETFRTALREIRDARRRGR